MPTPTYIPRAFGGTIVFSNTPVIDGTAVFTNAVRRDGIVATAIRDNVVTTLGRSNTITTNRRDTIHVLTRRRG